MPRGDRTGPMGSGPMTGRGMGYCAGSAGPGIGFGRGFGFGRGLSRGSGLGRGRRWQQAGFSPFLGDPYPQATPYSTFQPFTEEQGMDALEEQSKILEGELNQLKKRLSELKKQKQDKQMTNK
ncbi:DUF5320 domain-containing protein [Acidobacteriota bacterium]